MHMNLEAKTVLLKARQCLKLEIEAIQATADALDSRFVTIIDAIQQTLLNNGKLVFTGIGKNVSICKKLIGTFNSTGIPATFLDPNQALHGDLGLCNLQDLVFFFSNSGETEGLIQLLPIVKRLGPTTVAVTARPESSLATNCDLALFYVVEKEACPLNLAPTASTTAALALGDALAMVCLELRGFTREDFARFHPSGNLGKSLLLRVSEIMRTGERFAARQSACTVQEALLAITQARCGTIALTSEDGRLSGVFSDGDFRRAALKDPLILQQKVSDFMTRNPITIRHDMLAVEALKVFERTKINALIVVDANNCPIGLLDGQDLPKLHIV
jgi:arabinose-5-phosphate isomerase